MKNYLLVCTVLTAMLFASGCKKDDPKDETPEATLSVKIDGVQWTATKEVTGMYVDNNNILQIMGTTADPMDYLHISIVGYEVGTHPMTIAGNSGTYKTYSSIYDFSRDGEIVVTACDTVNDIISGTFRFKGYDMQNMSNFKTFTEGSFTNVKFTREHVDVK